MSWFSAPDNSPPGRETASGAVAGGTGTFADPITIAVAYDDGDSFVVPLEDGKRQFKFGTMFYIADLQVYGIAEDVCGACDEGRPGRSAPQSGNFDYFIDIWTGDSGGACTTSFTGIHKVIKDPPDNLPVRARPNELAADCSTV